MGSRNITFADLDALLRRLGFSSRMVEVAPRGLVDNGSGDGADERRSRNPGLPAVLYENVSAEDALILLPRRPPDAPVEPQHLIPTRRQLIERGLIEEDEFERWLCAMRFGDVRREPAATGAADGRTRRDATG